MMPAATRSSATAASRCSATDAGLSPCRIALRLSALLDVAEGARAGAALTAGCRVSSRRLPVSVEGSGRCAGTVGNSAARTPTGVGKPTARTPASVDVAAVGNSAARAPTPVDAAPVIKRVAPGVVPAAAKSCISVAPIESPVIPPPSKTPEETDSKTHPKRQVGAAIPNAGIRIPSRPRHNGISVNHPRIICGDVNDLGVSRLNADRRVLVCYDLLRRGLKITGFFRPLAHHLYGIHHILLLVVVGVA